MRVEASAEHARRLAAMPSDKLRAWLAKCRPQELLLLDAAFEMWAAEGQIPPSAEGWRVWLMMAGRGYGKTRAGAEWIHQLAMSGARRIALVGASIDEARTVMVEGVAGILSIARRYRTKIKWEPSLGRLTWPKGSVAQLFSGDHPDGVRGPEHHFAWADELAKWRRAEEAWINLEMGLRSGTRPRVLITTTPRPLRLLERLRDDKRTVTTGARSERIELPAVLAGDQAKVLVEEALARRFRSGDRIKISLPPSRMALRPGDAIQMGGLPSAWTIRSATISGLSVDIEAEGAPVGVVPLPADSGRPVAEPDVPIGRTELLLFEAPPVGDMPSDLPIAHIAGASIGAWKTVPLELRLGQEPLPGIAMLRQAVMGHAQSVLAPRSPMIMDELSSVTVKLVGEARPLLNADDDALMAGANMALLGDELIQFGRAEEIAAGTFRLSRLLRGRRGTEWAVGGHVTGESFCLLDQSMRPVELPAGAIGNALTAVAHGIGDAAPLPEAQRLVTGEALRPPTPCHLKLWRDGSGGIGAGWTRRTHRGWAWLDEVGVPDDPFGELYRVTIEGPEGSVLIETDVPNLLIAPTELPASAGESIRLAVVTIGPKAVSHEIFATLIL